MERHQLISTFVPQQYWTIVPRVTTTGRHMDLHWERGRIFDKDVGAKIIKILGKNPKFQGLIFILLRWPNYSKSEWSRELQGPKLTKFQKKKKEKLAQLDLTRWNFSRLLNWGKRRGNYEGNRGEKREEKGKKL